MYAQLRTHTGDQIDTVILGCPHASLNEIAQIAAYLKGKQVADGITLWVCSAYATRAAADRLGYSEMISEAGGKMFCDTCPTNSMRVDARRIVIPDMDSA